MSLMINAHVHHDCVWCSNDEYEPFNAATSIGSFIQSELLRQVAGIRVIATPDNMQLLLRLQDWNRRFKRPRDVRIGCPQLVRDVDASPFAVLNRLRNEDLSFHSAGRWRPLTAATAKLAELSVQLRDKHCPTSKVKKLLLQHPAGPGLAFVPHVSWRNCAQWMCDVFDPRWFQHRARSHRLSLLFSFLGLQPRIIELALRLSRGLDVSPVSRKTYRAVNVILSWQFRADDDLAHPGDFVRRAYQQKCSGSPRREVYATLCAARLFVRFIVLHWLAGTTARPDLYSPAALLKGDELVAYQCRDRVS